MNQDPNRRPPHDGGDDFASEEPSRPIGEAIRREDEPLRHLGNEQPGRSTDEPPYRFSEPPRRISEEPPRASREPARPRNDEPRRFADRPQPLIEADPHLFDDVPRGLGDHQLRPNSPNNWDEPAQSVVLSQAGDTASTAPKILAAAFLVVVVALAGYFVFRNREVKTPQGAASTAPPPAQTPEAAAPLGADVPAIDLPPLDQSDAVVRGLVKELSSNPAVAAWLMTDHLIRNFTAVVSNIAAGQPAAGQITVLRPRARFQVEERREDTFIDARSYARYLPLATAATSVDPQDAAKLYSTLKPRIEEAYRDLGNPDSTFDSTLERAIVVLLKTPVPQGRVPIQPNGAVTYRFADPALEKLTPVQKLLIRFGPDNQRTVQTSLRNIALALGIPAERLP